MIGICFSISGIIFLSIFMVCFFSKNSIKSDETKLYGNLLIITFIGSLIDIFSFILYKMGVDVNSLLYTLLAKGMLVYFVAWVLIFTSYVYAISKNSIIKYRSIIFKIIFVLSSISVLSFPIDFKKTANAVYPSGLGVNLTYLIVGVFLIVSIVLTLRNITKKQVKKYIPIFLVIIMLISATLVQKVFPDSFLINFSLVTVVSVMYFTIENPDIKLSKELKYTKELLNKRNELASNTINNLIISIKEPLTEIANFSNKKINKNNISLSLEEIKELQKTTLSLVDKVNKVMDITRIESSDYSIKERKYQTSNLIDNIKGILEKNNKEVNYEISTLPKVLYGSDTNIVQTFSYLVDFISKNFENYTLSIKISNLLVRNKCHLKFSLVVDSKYNNLDMYEKDNKYTLSNKSIEYEIYEKLIDLQRGHNFISKDGSKVIFEFSLYQRQEEVKEINDNEEIEYFDASDKNVLVALNSHNDIRNLSELLMNYNVNITTAGSVNELNELLSSNKTFDLVFLSDTIYGIDNYDIKNINDFKRVVNKLSLVAGYKLDIVLVTLNNYQKENIEYLTLPISKTKLDDVLVKYLNED